MLYIHTKFCENICHGLKVKVKTGSVSILKIINSQSSVNTVDGINLFVCFFALLSDGGLYFYQAS